MIRIETFNEVKLEDLALGSRPTLDGNLKIFQEILFRRNLVGRHGVKIGQEAFSFDHGRFERSSLPESNRDAAPGRLCALGEQSTYHHQFADVFRGDEA